MGFKLRSFRTSVKFAETVAIQAIDDVVSPLLIDQVLQETGKREVRVRKLSAAFVIWFCIALNLYSAEAYKDVLSKLVKGLRYIWPDPNLKMPVKSALCQARYRLGTAPLVALFRHVGQPIADLSVPGAYLFGLRIMALDGTTEDVADTPANARYFGRQYGARGDSAFPKARVVYLSECCTHTICDAGIWPYGMDEKKAARRLFRSITANMLITIDRGLVSYTAVKEIVLERGAHVLARVSANWKLKPDKILKDGSYLAYLYPADYRRKRAGERLLVRVIAYTLTDPNRPGYGTSHRLITSLLDPESVPAVDLVCAYHQRWEIEIAIDEIDTHQRPANTPLRSRQPVGVLQEFYAMLVAYNAICALRLKAAQFAGVDPDRISFIVTLRKLCESIDQFQQTAPKQHPLLFKRLLQDIADEKLPERRNRYNPRVVKKKMSNFPLKREQHRPSVRLTKNFEETIQILN